MALYTRRGDAGETDVGTVRIKKDCDYTEAIGELDELSSLLASIASRWPETADLLDPILRDIYRINAYLATGGRVDHGVDPSTLERRIDEMWKELPPLSRFVLRFTDPAASAIHHARAVCRRAERRLVSLTKNRRWVDRKVLAYVNRLSDYLFAAARWTNWKKGGKEITA